MIWFDGNRPAALREFLKRNKFSEKRVSEKLLYAQMYRIEESQVIEKLKPAVINSFDEAGNFKEIDQLLGEIRNA